MFAAVELVIEVDRPDLVLPGKLREHRGDEVLDVALLMTEVVVQRLERRMDDLELSRCELESVSDLVRLDQVVGHGAPSVSASARFGNSLSPLAAHVCVLSWQRVPPLGVDRTGGGSTPEDLALYGAKADLLALGDFVVAEPERLKGEEPTLARGELRKLFAPLAVALSLDCAISWVGGVAGRLWELDRMITIIRMPGATSRRATWPVPQRSPASDGLASARSTSSGLYSPVS